VIGDVSIGKFSSIWYGATVRGDVEKVTIGSKTSIGDRSVVHVAKIHATHPTIIGDNVTICPGAVVHACTLQDSCMIGSNAQVLDGSVVESNSIVAPGSVVTSGTIVSSGCLYSGAPAKEVRKLTEAELASILESADDNLELAIDHEVECSKNYKQIAYDEDEYFDKKFRDEETNPRMEEKTGDILGQGEPGRIFDTTLSHPEKIGEQINKNN